ncbi:hypothetical protein SAMN05421800_101450 [Chryseobacterium balustinum]|uniref:Uncharacterized protein n=1 Tax=Chryseobacterium balustinum TaxID=246 RepID=A0ABY1L414_9FLAO|nr:hypothetical protein SAMN05421800_101450 [Chryseobacterium balustinum]
MKSNGFGALPKSILSFYTYIIYAVKKYQRKVPSRFTKK